MTTFTSLERIVITSFATAFNYSYPEAEKEDNATAINASDIVAQTQLDINTVKGVMGSLTKKGLLEEWGDDHMLGESNITDEGIDAYYRMNA